MFSFKILNIELISQQKNMESIKAIKGMAIQK